MGSWADYAIVIVCAASAVFGLWRGFVKEAFSLVTWLVAILCAWKFSWVVEPMLGEWIAQPGLKLWTARLAVLVLVLIAGGVIGWLVRAIVHTDRKSTRLNSSHVKISYAVFCLKKKN